MPVRLSSLLLFSGVSTEKSGSCAFPWMHWQVGVTPGQKLSGIQRSKRHQSCHRECQRWHLLPVARVTGSISEKCTPLKSLHLSSIFLPIEIPLQWECCCFLFELVCLVFFFFVHRFLIVLFFCFPFRLSFFVFHFQDWQANSALPPPCYSRLFFVFVFVFVF